MRMLGSGFKTTRLLQVLPMDIFNEEWRGSAWRNGNLTSWFWEKFYTISGCSDHDAPGRTGRGALEDIDVGMLSRMCSKSGDQYAVILFELGSQSAW